MNVEESNVMDYVRIGGIKIYQYTKSVFFHRLPAILKAASQKIQPNSNVNRKVKQFGS